MPDTFDAYHRWLGVPLKRFECDPQVASAKIASGAIAGVVIALLLLGFGTDVFGVMPPRGEQVPPENGTENVDDSPPLPTAPEQGTPAAPDKPDETATKLNPFAGRSGDARAQLVKQHGGSEESEKAVALALKWFAAHQLPDGSWDFEIGPCACTKRGTVKGCYTGATALALLPFLGSGQTHMDGEYKKTVERGLDYLVRTENPTTGSLVQGGGSMYSHGLASIALCEAYAMTGDDKLKIPAQATIAFITFAQDPVGGGWRYQPRQPGDTSVFGCQLVALKTGQLANFQVLPETIQGASNFLNKMQTDGGAKYGYTEPGAGKATTAIGLLSRMYLGWKQDEPALQSGAAFLSSIGPSESDLYFNYYATQVMHHVGGEQWQTWNNKMRDHLVDSQVAAGHMAGSWDVPAFGHANQAGGRLCVTSLATMILEVYYRHLPIYQD